MRISWGRNAAVTVALLMALAPAAATAAAPVLPSSDPFYSYSGSLSAIKPGSVLKSRTVSLQGAVAAFSAKQVLYRTTGELGQPTATVATIIQPLVSLHRQFVSWQTFYDGLGPQCRPSYTFQGGNGGYDASTESALMAPYLAAGDTIVTADYEGTNDEWVAGQESGQGTLDGVRAAEQLLATPVKSTPVAMIGYSGGAIATEWAAELQPAYAPELDLVGAAAGGIPVDLAHNLNYVNGSPVWSGVIPPSVVSLGRAFGVDVTPYLSAYGMKLVDEVKGGCINNFLGAFPGLKIQQMLKPQDQDPFAIAPLVKIFNELVMGTGGTPKVPMLLGNGFHDGTGDDVMIAGDVQGLAYAYCQRGVSVTFNRYVGNDHTGAAIPFERDALPFITERLAGLTVTDGCAAIAPGNSLAALPVPQTSAGSRLTYTYAGASKAKRGVVLTLSTTAGILQNVVLELRQGAKLVAKLTIGHLGTRSHTAVLRVRGRMPKPGRYTLTIRLGKTTLVNRNITLT
jgi:hypothetical protein